MKKTNKLFIVFVFAMIAVLALVLVGCNDKNEPNEAGTIYDMETRPFSMSISTPDGVFNPYFSSSAYDGSVVGMTQISMLSTDKEGNIAVGENEPCVVKDYTVKEATTGGNTTTTYEFLIKNGIKFSDGEDLTIKDVLFNLYVYLDPAYTGSSTIYSTEIVGLSNYRQQQPPEEGDTTDLSAFENEFVVTAAIRLEELQNYVRDKGKGAIEKPGLTYADPEAIEADFAYVAREFRKELYSDWNDANVDSYTNWKFNKKWQVFLFTDGEANILQRENPKDPNSPLKKDEDGNYILDEEAADNLYMSAVDARKDDAKYADLEGDELIKECCVDYVFESYFGQTVKVENTICSQFEKLMTYWATATTVLEKFTAEAKSAYFGKTDKKVPNIRGITTYKTNTFDDVELDGEYDVLSIVIKDVDPKAIYNFAYIVAPMHYYSGTFEGVDYVAEYDGKTNFGLKFASAQFMDTVLNAPSKVGLPVGAGAYKASNASGSGTVTGGNFFNNNIIYFERNEYFNTVGRELSNAKIKYVRYKVVESDQIINSLTSGDVDFGEPSATQENIDAVESSSKIDLGHVEIETSGYGYVGINPRFVPNILVRRIIMKAMNTQLILDNYYKNNLAELIYRPMSKTSWAYPKSATTYVYHEGKPDAFSYKFDNNGENEEYNIEELLTGDGYKLVNGIYTKEIDGFGVDKLSYKFTIAGGSTDHPAYTMFLKAAEILNRHGFDIKVVTSQTALSDLSNGKLAVWAAAWSSAIDPDMYQVYHMDSQASSTSNWGYNQIKANKTKDAYREEYRIIDELSRLIDDGRHTTDQGERKDIYAKALDLIMEFAVEMPTYQRKDMSAYNKEVLDESTMTPQSERSSYNGLLSRLWDLCYR